MNEQPSSSVGLFTLDDEKYSHLTVAKYSDGEDQIIVLYESGLKYTITQYDMFIIGKQLTERFGQYVCHMGVSREFDLSTTRLIGHMFIVDPK